MLEQKYNNTYWMLCTVLGPTYTVENKTQKVTNLMNLHSWWRKANKITDYD